MNDENPRGLWNRNQLLFAIFCIIVSWAFILLIGKLIYLSFLKLHIF